ncbi:MAG: hypothetical protein MHM6MM_007766 [Cercozoa sp. M6MM]
MLLHVRPRGRLRSFLGVQQAAERDRELKRRAEKAAVFKADHSFVSVFEVLPAKFLQDRALAPLWQQYHDNRHREGPSPLVNSFNDSVGSQCDYVSDCDTDSLSCLGSDVDSEDAMRDFAQRVNQLRQYARSHQFSPLRMLRKRFDVAEVRESKRFFRSIDVNRNGTISAAEFIGHFAQREQLLKDGLDKPNPGRSVSAAHALRAFKRIDKNNDACLTFPELLRGHIPHATETERAELVILASDMEDILSRGQIRLLASLHAAVEALEEFEETRGRKKGTAALETLTAITTRCRELERLSVMLDKVPLSRQLSTRVTLNQFLRRMFLHWFGNDAARRILRIANPPKLSLHDKRELRLLFNTVDTDADGFVSVEELREHLSKSPDKANWSDPMLDSVIQTFTQSFDFNRDGRIDFAEFQICFAGLVDRCASQSNLLHIDQFDALLDMWSVCDGPNWARQWDLTERICGQAGVVCALEPARPERLSLRELVLPQNRIKCTLPASFSRLVFLHRLVLPNNELSGDLPSQSFWSITSLREINLSGNLLRGTIPGAVRNMTSLTSLDLDGNMLRGDLSRMFGLLDSPQIVDLSLSGNMLFGDIDLIDFKASKTNVTGPLRRLQLGGGNLWQCSRIAGGSGGVGGSTPNYGSGVPLNDFSSTRRCACPRGLVFSEFAFRCVTPPSTNTTNTNTNATTI